MNIKKALVVDDSKVAHLTLRKLLIERGIEVDWVGSGEDCIKYLDTKKPEIIFMDVMMPGMDGFETSRAITSKYSENASPIIMCSANATDEDKRDAKDSGAVGFLSKPYTPQQLDEVLQMVGAGTSSISMGEATLHRMDTAIKPPVAAPKPIIAPPPVVEKAPPTPVAPAQPPTPVPVQAPPAPSAPATAAMSTAEIEQLAERAAWAAAEKVARDIVQELVPGLAREIAQQTAHNVAEDLGRRAAHAAVRAAQEAAKQVATEIARGTAERTARTTAQESARSVAEQAAREVSEGISQRNVARGLEINREELLKEIEEQISRQSHETLGMLTGAPEFKQQIIQTVRSGIQPVIETIARDAANKSVQQATAELAAQSGGGSGKATAALVMAIIAVLGSLAALAHAFKVF
ncbi:MAG: response regulator [Synechococcaceae cyanobacterium SM1_2_3]|nr:response regulator [Synechococcaceae cyanobacterium SM1_2_3]